MSKAKYRKVFKGNFEVDSNPDAKRGHLSGKKNDKVSEKNEKSNG